MLSQARCQHSCSPGALRSSPCGQRAATRLFHLVLEVRDRDDCRVDHRVQRARVALCRGAQAAHLLRSGGARPAPRRGVPCRTTTRPRPTSPSGSVFPGAPPSRCSGCSTATGTRTRPSRRHQRGQRRGTTPSSSTRHPAPAVGREVPSPSHGCGKGLLPARRQSDSDRGGMAAEPPSGLGYALSCPPCPLRALSVPFTRAK